MRLVPSVSGSRYICEQMVYEIGHGDGMEQFTQPTKEQVRDWLKHRLHTVEPPPNGEQIRHELGWTSHETCMANQIGTYQVAVNN